MFRGDVHRPSGLHWINWLNSSESCFTSLDHHATRESDGDGGAECHLCCGGERHGSADLAVAEEQREYHGGDVVQLHDSGYHRCGQ